MNNAHVSTNRLPEVTLLRDVIAAFPTSEARATALDLIDSLPTGITGARSLKAWMQANDGRTVQTVQVQWGTPWVPGPRVVDAGSRATYVLLGGSRRDYAGVRVVASDERSIVVSGGDAIIAFVTG